MAKSVLSINFSTFSRIKTHFTQTISRRERIADNTCWNSAIFSQLAMMSRDWLEKVKENWPAPRETVSSVAPRPSNPQCWGRILPAATVSQLKNWKKNCVKIVCLTPGGTQICCGHAVSSSRTRSRASRTFWPTLTARDASSSNRKRIWAVRFSAQLILYLIECFVYQLKGNQSRPVRRMLMVWQLNKRFNLVLKYGLCTLSSSFLHDGLKYGIRFWKIPTN